MDVSKSHTYGASVDAVVDMFGDPDAVTARYAGMGHRDIEIRSCERTDDALTVVSSRVVDVDLPGFAKKVLKPTNTVISTDHWRDFGDGTYGGTFSADTKGAPIKVSGTTRITAAGPTRTHYVVTTTIDVKVPLIGGKIADFSKGIINGQMDDEFRLGDAWLTSH